MSDPTKVINELRLKVPGSRAANALEKVLSERDLAIELLREVLQGHRARCTPATLRKLGL